LNNVSDKLLASRCAPQTTYQTSHGQLLDLTTAPPGTIDLSRYTMDNYLRIVTYKTAFYTFYLPVAAGLVLAGETRPAAFDLAKSICVTMGQYFQVGCYFSLLYCQF
jgi:farnesyl diphosphate synthase